MYCNIYTLYANHPIILCIYHYIYCLMTFIIVILITIITFIWEIRNIKDINKCHIITESNGETKLV